ncbi:hypothetical protein OJAV_G00110510 [Oryzias javanicus]|uniref:Major facilitator superfamily (MFS) profile domain-containing protein n=1 Tax=Oryzias javanicus TaxID=123683 RepID=A0A3S2PPZ2_ORYJA|nr:hypothetical protein OJAV_G00110510 [Oryzias javanicus]
MSLPNGYSINSPPSDNIEDEEPLIKNDPVDSMASNSSSSQCCSARLNLAFLMFLGFSVVYGLRVNLSVAMVAMVNSTDPDATKNSSIIHACPLPSGADNSSQTFLQPVGIPQYPWDSETQGWLLGAFFFGYLCTQIPGGYLAGHYGGSIFLGLGSVGGLRRGCDFPSYDGDVGSLGSPSGALPPDDPVWIWVQLWGLFGSATTGYICEQLGWPAVFYICGGAGCLWAVLWFAFASDDPRTHRRISEKERDYIINSIGPQGTGHGWSLPFLSMALSVPLWAIILTQMSSNWAFYTLLTSLPTYMSDILHFDLQSNGFLSALPYLGSLVVSLLSAVAADLLIERKVFSVTIVRKIFTVTGLVLPAVFLVAVNYAGCDHVLTVTFFTLSSSLGGTSAPGVYINQIDIAPRYAGFLLGITNTFGTIPGVLAPIVTGYFTEDHSLAGWRKVFWVAAGINLGGALIYLLLGTADIQPWANTDEEHVQPQKRRSVSIS